MTNEEQAEAVLDGLAGFKAGDIVVITQRTSAYCGRLAVVGSVVDRTGCTCIIDEIDSGASLRMPFSGLRHA